MKAITLNIKSSLENVALVGHTVNKFCSIMSFSETEVYQTELCVVEACNNVIKHGYSDDPDQDIAIQIQLEHDRMIFKISDSGKSMKSFLRPSPEFDPQDRQHLPENGLGLFLINEIMNDVEYQSSSGQNVLMLTKFYSDRGPVASDQSKQPASSS